MDIPNRIEAGLQQYSNLILGDPALRAEFEGSIAEFFGGPLPEGDPRATLLAARRHVEWFVLERHSPGLFKTPVEGLLEAWRAAVPDEVAEVAPAFLDSFTGVFRVTSVVPGEGAWLEDLAGFGQHPTLEPPGGAVLQVGDVVAGRVFPVPGRSGHLSIAAFVLRDPGLLAAMARDLEAARNQQGGSRVLHVSQREIEAMFQRSSELERAAQDRGRDAIEAARTFLATDGGLAPPVIDALLDRLAAEPFDGSRFAHGAGDILGEILDEFAFQTSIDLTRAREILILAWHALSSGTSPDPGSGSTQPEKPTPRRPTQPSDSSPRAAVNAFEQGRRAGQDLEALFDALERDLGLSGEDDGDEEATPAPDFPGVIGAMVEEFLWEVQEVRQEPEMRKRFEVLRSLGRFGERIGVFESLSARDLLRFTAFWLTERREVRDAASARNLLEALGAFCEWAENAHEHQLHAEFADTLRALEESLPRVVEANAALPAADASEEDDTGELFELLPPGTQASETNGDSPGGEWRLRDRGGREYRAEPPGVLRPMVRPGDRLRGRIELDGRAVVYCVYPPEAADLLA